MGHFIRPQVCAHTPPANRRRRLRLLCLLLLWMVNGVQGLHGVHATGSPRTRGHVQLSPIRSVALEGPAHAQPATAPAAVHVLTGGFLLRLLGADQAW